MEAGAGVRQAFGRRLNEAMIAAGLSTADLARRIDRPKSSVNRWRGGENMPDNPTLAMLGRVLNVDPVWLAMGHTNGLETNVAEVR